MSEDKWDNLPELLRPGEAMRLLGLGREGLRALAKSRPEAAVVLPGYKHPRYRKTVLARLAAGEYAGK